VKLLPCLPNPFSEKTTISYELPARADVSISIYDVQGKRVAFWSENTKNTGLHSVEWQRNETENAGSSLYFCQIFVNNEKNKQILTQKIIHLN